MIWPILIVATLSSILVGSICLALGVRKLFVVLPAQFVVAFGTAYAVTAGFTGAPGDPGIIWTCLAAAIAVPATWSVMAAIVGPPLSRRRSARTLHPLHDPGTNGPTRSRAPGHESSGPRPKKG